MKRNKLSGDLHVAIASHVQIQEESSDVEGVPASGE